MLCLACHENTIELEFALAAHGVDLQKLTGSGGEVALAALDDRLRDPRNPIACSACHREHQGRHHNLAAMTDRACQACHREQYESFAGDHPKFDKWPYERRTRIAFDHASHQGKHFPIEKREFTCAMCHESDATGRRQLTGAYATTCADCHDSSLIKSFGEGLPLLALPTLDVEALQAAGHEIGAWPAAASGDFDGALPAALQLLLAADPRSSEAMRAVRGGFDFYDVDPDDKAQLATAAALGAGIGSVVNDVSKEGGDAIVRRLAGLLERDLGPAEIEALTGRMPKDVAVDYRDKWFGPELENAEDERTGGETWWSDDATLSLRYRPLGHADPWVRAWLDVLAEAANGPHAAIAEPLLRAALKPTTPGQCGSCHSVERDAAGRFAIQWRPFDPADERRGFSYFDHGPHLIQPQTADCTSCHRIDVNVQTAASYTTDDAQQFVAGFEPLSKDSCASCHTPRAAGDGCMQCHSYHGGSK
jgi:hypothetical protein